MLFPRSKFLLFPNSGRDRSLSEVRLTMLPAATMPETRNFSGHFNIEGQVSLNDLSLQLLIIRLLLVFVLGINIFHRGRQNHVMCSSVAMGGSGNRCAFGSSIHLRGIFLSSSLYPPQGC